MELVKAALLVVEVVCRVLTEEDPYAYELGEGLADGLHEKHGGQHSGSGRRARPFRCDDSR